MSFEFDKPKTAKANLHSAVRCHTCGGDHLVLVSKRKPMPSAWLREHGIESRPDRLFDEFAACPACNTADTAFWRHDGFLAAALDPAKVRQLMTPPPPRSLPTPPAEARVQVEKILKDMA